MTCFYVNQVFLKYFIMENSNIYKRRENSVIKQHIFITLFPQLQTYGQLTNLLANHPTYLCTSPNSDWFKVNARHHGIVYFPGQIHNVSLTVCVLLVTLISNEKIYSSAIPRRRDRLSTSKQSILREINPEYSLEGLCWSRSSSSLVIWCEQMTHWKSPWCWERLRAEGEEGFRRWNGWMASLMQWTGTWANSGRRWGTERTGVLQSMGLDMTGLLNNNNPLQYFWAILVAQMVKNPLAMWETWVWSLGWQDPLEEGMVTHSSILAWRIPMDRGSWQATVHGVAKSQTWLSD